MRHLARAHGLYGANEEEHTLCDIAAEGCAEIRSAFSTLAYTTYDSEEKRTAHHEYMVGKMLPRFERILEANSKAHGEGKYLVGTGITYADYILFELLDLHVMMFESCLDSLPRLKAYYERVKARPNLQAYFSSDRRMKYANGRSAKWGPHPGGVEYSG